MISAEGWMSMALTFCWCVRAAKLGENSPMTTHKLYLRHLLLSRSDWMERRLFDGAARNGYGDLTPAMARLCAHLAGRPLSLSELARRLTVSRQAVHKLAAETANLGYVEFVDSEQDARVKLLRFTLKGWDMAESARQELEAIEAQLIEQLGADKVDLLKDVLAMPWSADERARGRRG